MAKDSFFVGGGAGAKKRKAVSGGGGSSNKKVAAKKGTKRPQSNSSGNRRTTRRKDSDNESDNGNERGEGEDALVDVDDMDLTDSKDNGTGTGNGNQDSDEEEDAFTSETPAQKRLRLAKSYISKVEEDVADDIMQGEIDAKELDRDIISSRLAKDADQATGKHFRKISQAFAMGIDASLEGGRLRTLKTSAKGKLVGHQLSITSIAFSKGLPVKGESTVSSSSSLLTTNQKGGKSATTPSTKLPPFFIYSTSKDATLLAWDFWTGKVVTAVPRAAKKDTKRLKNRTAKSNANNGGANAIKKNAASGHSDEILCMDASSDGRYIATGSRDKSICIWENRNNTLTLKGRLLQHRDAISGLKFRKTLGNGSGQGQSGQDMSQQLYSASFDRTVKVWNVDEMSYVETLFGHQDQILDLDCLAKERCLTAGARDRTCRLWKILEESQLVFRGGGGGLTMTEDLIVMESMMGDTAKKREKDNGLSGGSIDIVAMIDEDYFVSGSDTGAISLWNVGRKKPLFTKLKCHGGGATVLINGVDATQAVKPHTLEDVNVTSDDDTICPWITSLATVPYSDLFASGSGDGFIRLWKLSESKKSFGLLNCIPVYGFVNDIILFEAPALPKASADSSIENAEEDVLEAAATTATAKKIIRQSQLNAKGASSRSTNLELYLGAAIGQEVRLGRWFHKKDVKNRSIVCSLGALPSS